MPSGSQPVTRMTGRTMPRSGSRWRSLDPSRRACSLPARIGQVLGWRLRSVNHPRVGMSILPGGDHAVGHDDPAEHRPPSRSSASSHPPRLDRLITASPKASTPQQAEAVHPARASVTWARRPALLRPRRHRPHQPHRASQHDPLLHSLAGPARRDPTALGCQQGRDHDEGQGGPVRH